MKKKAILIGLVGVFLLFQPIHAQTWTASKRLTFTSDRSFYPALAVDSNGHIHVVWDDETPGNREVYYKKSTDAGSTWTTKRLTYSSSSSRDAVVAIDSNDHIHVAWMDESPGNSEIYYKKSTNGGANWTTKRLTYNSGASFSPAITVDSNDHIHLVWDDDSPLDSEIFYKRSTDGGATWTTKRLTYNSLNSWYPIIAVASNNHLYVVWHQFSPSETEIYLKRSTNGGVTWTTKRLTYNSGYSRYPAIAMDSNDHIHLVWDDDSPGNLEIYYKKSTDGGTNWTTKRLTDNSGGSKEPSIAVDSGNRIHVVWMDLTPVNYEIFYRKSTDGGANWRNVKRLTWNSNHSEYPSVATDSSDNIHVVWQDYTPGNLEIYYKKGTQ